jgi:hypothetical protein
MLVILLLSGCAAKPVVPLYAESAAVANNQGLILMR